MCKLFLFVFGISVLAAFAVDSNDMEVLTKTVFMEARGESPEGQAAVIYVIKERARKNKEYWGGDKIANICKHPGQFECWNHDGNPIQQIDESSDEYQRVKQLVKDVMENGAQKDQDDGSDHFNNPAKEGYPEWTKNCDQKKVIGNHHFYKTKPGF